MTLNWFRFFAFWLVILFGAVKSTTDCSKYYQCASSNISSEDIGCHGAHSCFNASLHVHNGILECLGAWSCYEAQKIVEENYKATGVRCRGLGSCAKVKDFTLSNASLGCGAEISCADSIIDITDGDISCNGFKSCANSTIRHTRDVTIHGTLAAYNTTFYANSSGNKIDYHFKSSEGGKNAQIICLQNTTCNIHCQGGSSCNDLTYTCVDCDEVIIDCVDGSDESDICHGSSSSTGYNSGNNTGEVINYDLLENLGVLTQGKLPIFENMTISNYYNSTILVCDKNTTSNINTIVCDSDEECSDVTLLGGNDLDAPICCTGRQSCNSIVNVTVNRSNGSLIAIRADGHRAFQDSSGYIISQNSGNMYFTSYRSAGFTNNILESTIISTSFDFENRNNNNYYKENNNNWNIFCTGENSCTSKTITNVKTIHIHGDSAGRFSLFKKIQTIYAHGYQALYEANGTNEVENVYCQGLRSCSVTTISNTYNIIYASGYQVLSKTNIFNVANETIAIGEQALYLATLTNVTKVM